MICLFVPIQSQEHYGLVLLQQFYLKNVHDYDWEYDQLWFLVVSNCSDPYRF